MLQLLSFLHWINRACQKMSNFSLPCIIFPCRYLTKNMNLSSLDEKDECQKSVEEYCWLFLMLNKYKVNAPNVLEFLYVWMKDVSAYLSIYLPTHLSSVVYLSIYLNYVTIYSNQCYWIFAIDKALFGNLFKLPFLILMFGLFFWNRFYIETRAMNQY